MVSSGEFWPRNDHICWCVAARKPCQSSRLEELKQQQQHSHKGMHYSLVRVLLFTYRCLSIFLDLGGTQSSPFFICVTA